jgi:uncharacterized protein
MIQETIEFVKETLKPSENNYAMLYRFEHTLRTAVIGKKIAIEEQLPIEPLIIGCLLHDIGYCKAEWEKHAEFGEKIAKEYLEKINYPKEFKESICKGILIHDGVLSRIDSIPTPFELSIRDADDIDRFDAMRMGLGAESIIGENPVNVIIDNCTNRIKNLEFLLQHECATKTANRLWQAKITDQLDYFNRLQVQMNSTNQLLL